MSKYSKKSKRNSSVIERKNVGLRNSYFSVSNILANSKNKRKIKNVAKPGKSNFVVTPLNRITETEHPSCISTESIVGVSHIESSVKELPKKLRKKKKQKLKSNAEVENTQSKSNRSHTSPSSNPSIKESISTSDHKDMIRQKLSSKRLEKGLIMLSPKAEAKIYKLKKALRKKGLPEQEVRQIIRQKRRSEELKYRSSFGSSADVCFKCRRPGHRFAECKLVVDDADQGTGVCFSCGSTEHILKNCPNKMRMGKLPFAKCFVCGQLGHLSRECPSNPKGAFPKGGKCNSCGSINHLKKDCPQLQNSDTVVCTMNTVKYAASADALDDE